MKQLPDWWNELSDWLLKANPRTLPPNMGHVWRVNRYADKVCNGGLCDFLRSTPRSARVLLAESVAAVGRSEHVATLGEALAFVGDGARGPRIPREAWAARMIAYDSLQRGWSREQTTETMGSIAPECPRKHYEAVLTSASLEVAQSIRWDSLDRQFFHEEPGLRLCIALFAERNMNEWRELH